MSVSIEASIVVTVLSLNTTNEYEEIHVLFFNWQDDDVRMYEQLENLEHVLKKSYKYDVKKWLIPVTKPNNVLTRKLLNFKDNDDFDRLFILYYVGHDDIDMDRNVV